MAQMNKAYRSSNANVNGKGSRLARFTSATYFLLIVNREKTAAEMPTPDSLTSLLANQLQIAIAAVEARQADAVIGEWTEIVVLNYDTY